MTRPPATPPAGSEQNLLMDESGKPVSHPRLGAFFTGREDGRYIIRETYTN